MSWIGGAFPTPTEARNLLYPPFLNGAKGAIFYTYWGENGVLPTVAPALWSERKREVVELKTLTPFLLHGARGEMATGNPVSISETPSRRTLKWNWKGPATSADDLGDPRDESAYALCLYDAGGSALATAATASASRWTQTGSGGFRLRDAAGEPGGITRARLQPGADGRARISILARGAALPDPDLPLALPVTVQAFHSGGGPCWSAVFPAAQQSTDTRFRARKC